MRNILIVEADQKALESLKTALRSQADQWDTMYVSNAAMALKGLEAGNFDVIVSDMCMPGMDGATLLSIVRQRYPDLVRVGLLDDEELDAPLRALPVAHQVLDKPCDATELADVIDRSCSLQDLLFNKDIQKAVGGVESLPTLPKIYRELTEALADPQVDFNQVAAIVERDASMSAKILQIVNSGFFGLRQPVSQVRNAISMLGISMVRTLVLSVEVFRPFRGQLGHSSFTLTREQHHALLTANIAKNLVDTKTQSEDCFTAAVLHDLGKLILATRRPEVYLPLFEAANEGGPPAHRGETEQGAVSHESVGAYLLGLWGLPWPIVEAVAYHHHPALVRHDTFETMDAIYVANLLAHEVTGGGETQEGEWDVEHLGKLGVLDEIPRWREMAQELTQGKGIEDEDDGS